MQLGQPTAKIYSFPTKSRFAAKDSRVGGLRSPQEPVVDFACSYHDAAIEEEASKAAPQPHWGENLIPFSRH